MNDVVERLSVVLASEEELYGRMRNLLEREAESLARLDAEAFALIVREKEELGDEGRLLEEVRIGVARELGRGLGLDAVNPRLSDLCRALEQAGENGEGLRAAHNRLIIVIGIVRELLESNANLARESLLQVRSTLGLLGGPVGVSSGETGYGASSQMGPGQLLRHSV